MRREWRFGGRSAASQSGCGSADGPRRLADVADAWIDRRPIDWAALLARVEGSSDRALCENLCLVDRLRRAPLAAARARESSPQAVIVVRLLAALATVQTACCLGIVALAFLSGETTGGRTSQIALAVAFAAAGVVLAAGTRRDSRTLLLVAAFVSVAGAFARGAVLGLPDRYAASIAPVLRGMYPEAFTPACLWQFALDFPRVRRFTSFDLLARRAAAGAWLLGGLLFGVNFLAEYDAPGLRAVSFFLRDHPGNGFWSLFAVFSLPALGAVLVRSRRAGCAERRKIARFAVAIAAGTAPVLLSGVTRLLLPRFSEWLRTAGPGERGWLDGLIVAALMATPILGTIALLVDRPFELQAIHPSRLRDRLARGAVIATVAAPFAAILVTFYALRALPLEAVFSGARTWWLVACAVAGCLLLLTRSTLLQAVDRRALGAAVDHHERLVGALERIRTARSTREINAALERELRRGVGAAVRVLIPGSTGAFVDPSLEITPLASDTAVIRIMLETAAPLDLSPDRPLRPLLPKRDREWLAANDVRVVAPLKHRDGAIAAIVLLGPKRAGRAFTGRDRWLVRTLTTAAAAWDAEPSIPSPEKNVDPDAGRAYHLDEAAFECRRCRLVVECTPLPCRCGDAPVLASLPRHLAGKFIVERRLGTGGMGVVYLARDTTVDRPVALKTLPNLRDGAAARLRDEARAMAALNDESVATLYGVEFWRRTPVLVMEYFPNGTLAHRLADGPLSPGVAVALGIALAKALVYLHERNLLHRDLKPSNIAFTATGRAKLLDFGLVALKDPPTDAAFAVRGGRRQDDESFAGTPAYMPPEAYEGAPAAPAFDLWALAVVLVEAIGGRNPFVVGDRARPHRIVNLDPHGICASLPAVPPLWCGFFERALARKPELRFQTARDVLVALEALRCGGVD